jgi:hypothetical protein
MRPAARPRSGSTASIWATTPAASRASAWTPARRSSRANPNLLVVRVDASRPVAGGPTADTLPLGGDFFVHGGLYRAVSLVTTDKAHFDMLDFGGPGVYAQTTSIARRQGYRVGALQAAE